MDRRSSKTHLFIPFVTFIVLLGVILTNPFGLPDKSFKTFTPPVWYEAVWDLTWQHCTSKFKPISSYSYRDIKWYIVDAPHFNIKQSGDSTLAATGMTIGNKIFLSKDYTSDIELISHEMIHAQGIHITPYAPHSSLFTECPACIKSVIVNTALGKHVHCSGNYDTLTNLK
jgi:hypothetical protein